MENLLPGLPPSGGGSAPALTSDLARTLAGTPPPPGLDLDFTSLPTGNANGVAGLRVVGGTGTLGSNGLTVDAYFKSPWAGTLLSVPDLRGAELEAVLDGTSPYMLGARDEVSGWQATVWSAGGQFGSVDEFGFVNGGTDRVRPHGSLPIPNGRRRISLRLPTTLVAGEVVEIRQWLDGQPRPDVPSGSFVIGSMTSEGPSPTDVGALTAIGFNSISGQAVVRAVRVVRAIAAPIPTPEIERQALASAPWVPRTLNGQSYLACIAHSNTLDSWATGNARPGWVVTTPAGADYPSRVALYVDGVLDSVRECPIGVEGTLWVDLPHTKGHFLQLMVSGTHEGGGDSKLWTGVHGVYVRRLEVGSGSAEPPPEARRQIVVRSDSTGAEIVGRGYASSGPVSQPAQSAGELSWPATLGRRLGASVTNLSFGGQGLSKGGNGGVPTATAALGLAMAGQPLRWRNGLPGDGFIGFGANDTAQSSAAFQALYRADIVQMRALYPTIRLWLVLPAAGQHAAAVRQVAAETGCVAIQGKDLTFIPDGVHLDLAGGPALGVQVAAAALAGRGTAYWSGGASLPAPRIPLVLLNGWTATDGAPGPVVWREGGVVYVQAVLDNTSADTIITTLPEGYRPSGDLVVRAASIQDGGIQVAVRPNGEVQAYGGGGPSTRMLLQFQFTT